MVLEEWRPVLIMAGLVLAALMVLAAAGELARQAERADAASQLAEAAAWQVSGVMEDARRILREAAELRAAGGELA